MNYLKFAQSQSLLTSCFAGYAGVIRDPRQLPIGLAELKMMVTRVVGKNKQTNKQKSD